MGVSEYNAPRVKRFAFGGGGGISIKAHRHWLSLKSTGKAENWKMELLYRPLWRIRMFATIVFRFAK